MCYNFYRYNFHYKYPYLFKKQRLVSYRILTSASKRRVSNTLVYSWVSVILCFTSTKSLTSLKARFLRYTVTGSLCSVQITGCLVSGSCYSLVRQPHRLELSSLSICLLFIICLLPWNVPSTAPNLVPGTAQAFNEYLLSKGINVSGACLHIYEKHLHFELSSFCQFSSIEGELLLNSCLVVIATLWPPELQVISNGHIPPAYQTLSVFNYGIMMLL